MKYELTEIQHKNLIAFLGRVDLKGAEAVAYLEIVNALSKRVIEEKQEQK